MNMKSNKKARFKKSLLAGLVRITSTLHLKSTCQKSKWTYYQSGIVAAAVPTYTGCFFKPQSIYTQRQERQRAQLPVWFV